MGETPFKKSDQDGGGGEREGLVGLHKKSPSFLSLPSFSPISFRPWNQLISAFPLSFTSTLFLPLDFPPSSSPPTDRHTNQRGGGGGGSMDRACSLHVWKSPNKKNIFIPGFHLLYYWEIEYTEGNVISVWRISSRRKPATKVFDRRLSSVAAGAKRGTPEGKTFSFSPLFLWGFVRRMVCEIAAGCSILPTYFFGRRKTLRTYRRKRARTFPPPEFHAC